MLTWILKIRWARATHIETFAYPKVYAIHGPFYFISILLRTFCPFIIGYYTIRYVLTGKSDHTIAMTDIACRLLLCSGYNFVRNRNRIVWKNAIWLVLSQLFYQLPLPGIFCWGLLTALEGGWGTSMRSPGEMAKPHSGWRSRIWSTSFVIVWIGFVGSAVGKYLSRYFGFDSVLEFRIIATSFIFPSVLFFFVLFKDLLVQLFARI